jgi:hypothetical protein
VASGPALKLEELLRTMGGEKVDYDALREEAGGLWGDVGVAGWMVDKIVDAEPGCTRSFMHRYNVATGLMQEALGRGDDAAVAAVFVWLRFCALRQLVRAPPSCV